MRWRRRLSSAAA